MLICVRDRVLEGNEKVHELIFHTRFTNQRVVSAFRLSSILNMLILHEVLEYYYSIRMTYMLYVYDVGKQENRRRLYM